jgi:hypothetical protein
MTPWALWKTRNKALKKERKKIRWQTLYNVINEDYINQIAYLMKILWILTLVTHKLSKGITH